MPDFCTCGAELPPDARFCHKCGKPQREDEIVIEAPAPPPPPPPPAAAAPRVAIGFHNPVAVRIGLFTGLLAMAVYFFVPLLFPVWLGAAGFLGVSLYNRRTGARMTVREGARIGWLTAVFTFLGFSVFYTVGMVAALKSGELLEQIRRSPFLRGQSEQVIELLQNPVVLAISVLTTLFFFLVLFALFSVAGGAIGAKVLGKD